MKPMVEAYTEKEGVTILSIAFPEGARRNAFFFEENETKEEAAEQIGWRVTAGLVFHFCKDCDFSPCDSCTWTRRYFWAFAVSAVSAFFVPVLGLALAIVTIATLPFFAWWWIRNEPKRDEISRQHKWLREAFKKIHPFEEKNDFRGALTTALELRESAVI